jgi:peptidoglycan-associated lipoprotein
LKGLKEEQEKRMIMSMRKVSLVLLGFTLFLATTGCKKKAAPPPPPPPPKQEVVPPPPPPKVVISQFVAEPSTIQRGQSSTLRWEISNATDISINQSVGAVEARGNRQVSPTDSTTYTLTAKGPGGTDSRAVTVTVTVPPPPPPPPAAKPVISFSERLATAVQDAFFDYDKSDIREDARATLTRNSDGLKAVFRDFPNNTVSIEGHCDERGSAEYNLGLGDRRSAAAKDYLVQLGVPADKLKTISFGKERPQCTASSEDCWQKNRRVHFVSGQ